MLDEKDVDALKKNCRHMLRRELGLARVRAVERGTLLFHYECLEFVLMFDPHVPGVLCLRLPFALVVSARDADTASRIDTACNEVNRGSKLATVARRGQATDRGEWVVDASLDFVVIRLDAVDANLLEYYLWLLKRTRKGLHEAFESGGKPKPADTIEVVKPADAVVH